MRPGFGWWGMKGRDKLISNDGKMGRDRVDEWRWGEKSVKGDLRAAENEDLIAIIRFTSTIMKNWFIDWEGD